MADSGLIHILNTAMGSIQVHLLLDEATLPECTFCSRDCRRDLLTSSFLQKRPWTLDNFVHLAHSASAAWNASNATFSAHETVGRLNVEFQVVAKLLTKMGVEYGAFEQLPRRKEQYFQACSSKLMRCMIPNW